MGSDLKSQDLKFVQEDLALAEIERLKTLSKIDSMTLNVGGVSLVQDHVCETLENLGFTLEKTKGEARFAELVVAERPGRSSHFITLVTHADTVLPNFKAFEWDVAKAKASGSGVIDNKGGVVVGLSALERFLTHHPDTEYGLRFICSPNEEMGSIGFTQHISTYGASTVVAFGLEPALYTGSIIHQRRGNRWYDIDIVGREAHAGRSYGDHGNAAHDLAEKTVELARLTNYRKNLSVSVGHIEGGKDRHNIVCGAARAKLDVRFPSFEARESLHRKIEKILLRTSDPSLCGRIPTTTKYQIVDDCPPFTLTRRSKRLARTFAALISQLEGRKVYSQSAGGAGDVNYLATDKNFVLDGLGPVGGDMHTDNEFVWTDTLKTRSQSLAGFLYYLQTAKLEKFK